MLAADFTEVFNNNGISYAAAAFFTGMFGLLSLLITKAYEHKDKLKSTNADIKEIKKLMADHLKWHVDNPPYRKGQDNDQQEDRR